MWVHWVMEMAAIIDSTYERHKSVCISDIYCGFTLMHVSNDSLNSAICKVLLENSKQMERVTPMLKTMSAFMVHWRNECYIIMLSINNGPCVLFPGIIRFTACC